MALLLVRFMSSLHILDAEVYVVSSDTRCWVSCRPFRYYVMTFMPDSSDSIHWGICQSLDIVNTDIYVNSVQYIRGHIYLTTDDCHCLRHTHPFVIHKLACIIQLCVTVTNIASCNKQANKTKYCNVETGLCHILNFIRNGDTLNYNNTHAISQVN